MTDGPWATAKDNIPQGSDNPAELHVGGTGVQGHQLCGAYGVNCSASQSQNGLRSLVSQRVKTSEAWHVVTHGLISASRAAILPFAERPLRLPELHLARHLRLGSPSESEVLGLLELLRALLRL